MESRKKLTLKPGQSQALSLQRMADRVTTIERQKPLIKAIRKTEDKFEITVPHESLMKELQHIVGLDYVPTTFSDVDVKQLSEAQRNKYMKLLNRKKRNHVLAKR